VESPPRGRPRLVDRALIQEAAFELFAERTFAGTTVDEIARCAGISRGTFFNYFTSKADVFWVDLDDTIDRLVERLHPAGLGQPVETTFDAVREEAARYSPDRVPWALTQADLIGSTGELQSAALGRFTRLCQVLQTALRSRPAQLTDTDILTLSYSIAGAILAAAQTWAAAGVHRTGLGDYLEPGLRRLEQSYA